MKIKNYFNDIIIVYVVSIIFTVIILNKIILSSGYVLYSDFQIPIYSDRFVDNHILIWDSISSSPGIENIGRMLARVPFIILAYIGTDVGSIEKLMFISMFVIGILSAYLFLRKIIKLGHWSSLFLSLAYAIFMHFFVYLHQYNTPFGGMIFPSIFTFFYLGINNKKMTYIVISALLTVATFQMPFTLFATNGLILLYLVYEHIISVINPREDGLKFDIHMMKYYIIFMVLQIGIGSYYILPMVINVPSPEYMTSNIVTFEEVVKYSNKENYYPLIGFPLNLFGYNALSYYTGPMKDLQLWISIILLIILPFSTIGLIIKEQIKDKKIDNKDKKIKDQGNGNLNIFLLLTLFILWQLSLGDNGLLGSVYTSIVTKFSILNFMRSPQKFYVFIPFASIGLLGILFKSIKRYSIQISIIFLMLTIIASYPSINSWTENLKPIQIPEEFDEVQKIISEDINNNDSFFRTVWYPEYGDPVWAPLGGRRLAFEQRSKVPIYSYYRSGLRQEFIFGNYIWYLLQNNQTELASKSLNKYGVKYIIFHNDVRQIKNPLSLVNLINSNNFELVYQKGFIYLFRNKNYDNRRFLDINSDTPTLFESFDLQDSSSIEKSEDFFLDDGYNNMWDMFILSKRIIMKDYSNYVNNLIYYKFLGKGYYYYPGKQSFHDYLNKYWSVKSGWEINPSFNSYVIFNIDKNYSYSLDFGKKIIVTKGNNIKAGYNITIKKEDKYIFLIRYFENIKGGDIEIKIDNKLYTINAKNGSNRFIWKYIDDIDMNSGPHNLAIKNINGINAINIFGFIPENEYYETKKEIENILDKKIEIEKIDNERENYSRKDNMLLNYTKVDSNVWKIHVNSLNPFMLSFIESYDPQWKAMIYKKEGEYYREIKEINTIPLNLLTNGFWIDEIGDLQIIIKYGPKKWFDLGLLISVLFLLGCIFYIFYDLRKNKYL